MSLFGGLAEDVADALLGIALPLTITRTVRGPGAQVIETVVYQASGWLDRFSDELRASTLIQASDVRVMVLAATLSDPTFEPMPVDRVSIQGRTYTVIAVASDPARACWDCQAR